MEINSDGDNSPLSLIFSDEFFKSLMILMQILEQNDFISIGFI